MSRSFLKHLSEHVLTRRPPSFFLLLQINKPSSTPTISSLPLLPSSFPLSTLPSSSGPIKTVISLSQLSSSEEVEHRRNRFDPLPSTDTKEPFGVSPEDWEEFLVEERMEE